MDLGFCGIIDIVLVLLLLITCFLGYKKGFLNKAIGLIGLLVALVVAFVFCTQLAGWFKSTGFIYDNVFGMINNNVSNAVNEVGNAQTVKEALLNLGIFEPFAEMLSNRIDYAADVPMLISNISNFFTTICMNLISFIILFFGTFLCALLLKGVAAILRGNAIIRFVDGVLGIVLYCCLFLILLMVVFTIVNFMQDADYFKPIKEFMDVDMKLLDDNAFRLSKYLYKNNIIYSTLRIFF